MYSWWNSGLAKPTYASKSKLSTAYSDREVSILLGKETADLFVSDFILYFVEKEFLNLVLLVIIFAEWTFSPDVLGR